MSEIGTDRLPAAAPVPDRLGSPAEREEGQRRRRPSPPAPKTEPAGDLEQAPHEVDSLA